MLLKVKNVKKDIIIIIIIIITITIIISSFGRDFWPSQSIMHQPKPYLSIEHFKMQVNFIKPNS
jgi:hypothetical protein